MEALCNKYGECPYQEQRKHNGDVVYICKDGVAQIECDYVEYLDE